jgi:DNA-binding CsgD family transcriptional regulator
MRVERVLGEIISELEAETAASGLRRRLLEGLGRLAAFDSAMLMPVGAGAPTLLHKGLDLSQQYRVGQARYSRELQVAHAVGSAEGAYIDTDIYGAAERGRLAFFGEIIRPQGITCRIVAHLGFRGVTLATAHLCRHGRGRGFRRRELEACRAVVPSLGLAFATLPVAPPSPAGDELDALSPRQRQIVACVQRGYQNKEIADLFALSANTVRNHLAVIFKKLGVSTRAELAGRSARVNP